MKDFIVSSMHGNVDDLKIELNKWGYDASDDNHRLIVLGDMFGYHGDDLEMYKFLSNIPKNRLIFIRGSYEYRLLELLFAEHLFQHKDIKNGLVEAIASIANVNHDDIICSPTKYRQAVNKISKTFGKWLKENSINYYIDNDKKLLYCHSFLPTHRVDKELDDEPFEDYYISYLHPAKVMIALYNDKYVAFHSDNKSVVYKDLSAAEFTDWRLASYCRPDIMFKMLPKDLGLKLVCGHYPARMFNKNHSNDIYDGKFIDVNGDFINTGKCNIYIMEENLKK